MHSYARVYMRTFTHKCANVHTQKHTSTHTWKGACRHTCTYTHMCTHVHGWGLCQAAVAKLHTEVDDARSQMLKAVASLRGEVRAWGCMVSCVKPFW